ncbi:response regulator transcription factor [bacterium]|nr:response regulator transcription factor [bacterium]
MKKPSILIATADAELKRLLAFLLQKQGGTEQLSATSASEALRKAELALPALVLVDSALPGVDGLTLCRRLRAMATFLDTPIFFLGDRPEVKYQAFQAGATDVMLKPLDQLEFQYRLRVHLRARQRGLEPAEPVEAGTLKLEAASHTATLREKAVQLTPSEFAILSFLAAHPEQAVTTEILLVEALGEPRQLGNPQVIHTHIKNLRRKLEPMPAEPALILSSRRGYTFRPPAS